MNSEGFAGENKGWFRGRHSSNEGAALLPGADISKVVVATGISTHRVQDGQTITKDGSAGTTTPDSV
jgi:hypothetical protein